MLTGGGEIQEPASKMVFAGPEAMAAQAAEEER